MVKRLAICILILKIELNNALVRPSLLKHVGQKSDLDDGRFRDGSLGVQELVMKEVVPVCASKRYRVAPCVPDPTASYHASQNNGTILTVYL